MAEYNKFADLLKRLERVNSLEDYQELVKPKIHGYGDLQSTQDAILNSKISERFNLKPENLQTSEDLQKATNQILEQDYPHINKLREVVGENPLKTTYAPISGGSHTNISKNKNPWDVKLSDRSLLESILPTLGHEIGHANDDITKLIASIVRSGDNENSARVRDLLLNSNDNDIQKFLQDLEKHPNIQNQYNTRSSLHYDTPKVQQHLQILRDNPNLVSSSADLTNLKSHLEQALTKDNSARNLDSLWRSSDKLGDYFKDYNAYQIPAESRGQFQLGTDYGLNKAVSDVVPDNTILNSNADRHHLPRIDEVEGLGLADKGNWELRNIGRLFAGKGLKNLILPGLGLGAAALGTMDKAQAGDIPGAALTAASAVDPTGIAGAVNTVRDRMQMQPEDAAEATRQDRLSALPIGLDLEESAIQDNERYSALKKKLAP